VQTRARPIDHRNNNGRPLSFFLSVSRLCVARDSHLFAVSLFSVAQLTAAASVQIILTTPGLKKHAEMSSISLCYSAAAANSGHSPRLWFTAVCCNNVPLCWLS